MTRPTCVTCRWYVDGGEWDAPACQMCRLPIPEPSRHTCLHHTPTTAPAGAGDDDDE